MTELASFALRALVLLDTDALPQPHQTDEMLATGIRQLFLQHGLGIIDSLLPTPPSDKLVISSSPSSAIIPSGSKEEVEEDEGLMGLETLDWVSVCEVR